MPDPSEFRKSRYLSRVGPAATITITEAARALRATGRDVISLSIGEPDFPTPEHVTEAAARMARAGETTYPPVPGLPELRAAVAEKFRRENGLEVTPEQVIVSTGAKQVLANALVATLDPGDEVVIPAPFWVSYAQLVEMTGATPVPVPTAEADGFRLTPGALEAAITPRTRWLILNSPSNPSGAVYGADDLAALAEVLRRQRHVWVISDDIYEHLIYSEAGFATLAAVAPDLADRVLTVNGVSKAYAMTGWRIGYAAGPLPLIRAMALFQGQVTSGASRIGQWAAHAALTGPQDLIAERRAAYRARRDLVVGRLNAIPGLSCAVPDGAFYVYPSIAGLIGRRTPGGRVIDSDEAFCLALLEEAGVATVHGAAFGQSPFFRISYAAPESQLIAAMDRLAAFCGALDG